MAALSVVSYLRFISIFLKNITQFTEHKKKDYCVNYAFIYQLVAMDTYCLSKQTFLDTFRFHNWKKYD